MAAHPKKHEPEGFVGKHPALIAALFAIAVTGGFLFALISSAGSHGGGHGAPAGQHGSAPAHH